MNKRDFFYIVCVFGFLIYCFQENIKPVVSKANEVASRFLYGTQKFEQGDVVIGKKNGKYYLIENFDKEVYGMNTYRVCQIIKNEGLGKDELFFEFCFVEPDEPISIEEIIYGE